MSDSTEINLHFFSNPYFREIDGKNYDRRLLDMAEGFSKKNVEMAIRDVKRFFENLEKNTFSLQYHIEIKTLEYIRDNFKFTPSGKQLMETQIKEIKSNGEDFLHICGEEFPRKKLQHMTKGKGKNPNSGIDQMMTLYRLLQN